MEESKTTNTSGRTDSPPLINRKLLNYHMGCLMAGVLTWLSEQYNFFSKTMIIINWVVIMASSVFLLYQWSYEYFIAFYKSKFGTPENEGSKLYMKKFAEERTIIKVKEILVTICISLFFYFGLKLTDTEMYQFGLYMMSLSVYHFLEYWFWLMYHFEKVNADSFLINQGKFYTIAIALSFIEYFVEFFLFKNLKLWDIATLVTFIGVIITKVGHAFRIGAEFTAKSNFTHQIRLHKKSEHKLVTHGVYSISRHPGYFGWFLWSVGTQIMIWNPIWIVGFYLASYYFFKDRIELEEEFLIEFFGKQYQDYRSKVPTRIPFIE